VRALLVALTCPKGDLEGNLARHVARLEEAAAGGCDVAVFPEMSLTGYDPAAAVTVDHPVVAALAAETGRLGVAAVFGIVEAGERGAVHITQLLAEGGRLRATYRKRHLGEDEEAFTAGTAPAAGWAIGGRPVGIAICAESQVDDPFDDAAAAGAEVVLFCAAPGLYGRRVDGAGWRDGFDWWCSAGLEDARRHARRLGLWVVLAGQSGSTVDEDFPGLAALVAPDGEVVAQLPDWREGTLLVEICAEGGAERRAPRRFRRF
jgi:predicted amidohydrolase